MKVFNSYYDRVNGLVRDNTKKGKNLSISFFFFFLKLHSVGKIRGA